MRGISNRHWCKLGLRIFNLYLNQKHPSRDFVQSGYDEVASFYDTYWTPYMSQYSLDMLKKMNPVKGGDCLDLTCGTGFVTRSLFEMTQGRVTGVDVSEGMIAIAQQNYGDTCHFIIDDVYHFLKTQPSNSHDCITCAWGFGYVTPRSVQEIFRVLRPGGKVGIIDNSIFSNWEFVWFFLVALAEHPASLRATFEPHFFLSAGTLAQRLRMNRLRIIDAWNGKKIFEVKSTATALEQLIKSGVTAGILQLVDENRKEQIMTRIRELFETKYQQRKNIPIIHRYLAVIGEKR